MNSDETPTSRRRFLGLAAATTSAIGLAAADSTPRTRLWNNAETPTVANTNPLGPSQAGISRPQPPQTSVLVAVFDLVTADALPSLLTRLSTTIIALSAHGPWALAATDITTTVGIGPGLVSGMGRSMPGADELPRYDREAITPAARGGDVLIQLCGNDATMLPGALERVLDASRGQLRLRWSQAASRGAALPLPGHPPTPRNVLGFVDGIVGPAGDLDTSPDVWIESPATLRGASIAVIRRMEVDLDAFTQLGVGRQEALVGRRRATAAPLNGQNARDRVDLGAKNPDGSYVIPAGAHIRRANALATGVPAMLRRSYSIISPPGVLFICFQSSLRTFTATMSRMQAGDELFVLTRTTASGSFLILPGFDGHSPLGSSLLSK
ncbi:MAG: Dyp-type peroxidase [Actinomycetota bacterium]|nr:Dyp-type peroxidase [Actinomycetota bacterium]